MIQYLKVVQRLKFSMGIRKNRMTFLILPIVFCKSNHFKSNIGLSMIGKRVFLTQNGYGDPF